MSVIVKVLPNGPLQVAEGECEVEDAQGNVLQPKGNTIYFCRCGGSANKPFCDGSHKKIGFIAS